MRAVFFSYDIPDSCRYPNPSPKLSRVGARVNLSVWIIPEHLVPRELVADFERERIKYQMVRFDESESGKILTLARESLQARAEQIRRSMEGLIAVATAKLETVDPVEGEEYAETVAKAHKKYDRYVKGLLRTAKRQATSAQEAAVAFDLFADLKDCLDATRQAIASETSSFVARTVLREQDAPEVLLAFQRPEATPAIVTETVEAVAALIEADEVAPAMRPASSAPRAGLGTPFRNCCRHCGDSGECADGQLCDCARI